ncbi:inositol 1,4,5-triphosphate receptor associated 1 [Lissotriton helveticus]
MVTSGQFAVRCTAQCTPPAMPTPAEDEEQPAEPRSVSSPVKAASPEVRALNPPSIVLPDGGGPPGNESDKAQLNSPVTKPSTRHSRTSLTSLDYKGQIIDLVHDQLPDVMISEEDKKKNLELLEEAKKVSERFLTRRGRRSRCSQTEPPAGHSPTQSPKGSPVPSRHNSLTVPSSPGFETSSANVPGPPSPSQITANGLTDRKQNDHRKVSQGRLTPRTPQHLTSKETLSEHKENFDPLKQMANSVKTSVTNKESCKTALADSTSVSEKDPGKTIANKLKEIDSPGTNPPPEKGFGKVNLNSKCAPRDQPAPKMECKAEIKTFTTRPPLLRALSWDSSEPGQKESISESDEKEEDNCSPLDTFSNKLPNIPVFKDFHIQPVRLQKLSKLREEHKLMRNQNLSVPMLPDLSEAAEHERGPSPVSPLSTDEEEGKVNGNSDSMPNISDLLLRKLRVNKSLPGSAPPLTEKEVENVFVQLSLAYRNDSYTLESRLHQAERERNLTEENNEKELETFKTSITASASLWQHSDHRDAYQKLLEDIAVLHRLTARLSSRAEMVGAVRQEKRMSRATEVMMQYVENLKRTYEKDHAELTEYKKLANQNSSRSYNGSEDGVPRSARSMSLTIGKNMPRRRVSVAVVPKFTLLSIPGQSPQTSHMQAMPTLSESPNGRTSQPPVPVLTPLMENGKSPVDREPDVPVAVQPQVSIQEINAELKAKIEAEAYKKGYREGIKKTQVIQELDEEEENIKETQSEPEKVEKEEEAKGSKIEEYIDYLYILYPKLLKHWNIFSLVAAAIILFALIMSIYNSYTCCTESSGESQGKETCSAGRKYSWWNPGLQQKQCSE